jgi:DNA-binding Lrp family transcriptional regulator
LTAKALLLISADLGDERNVHNKLKSIQNVKEAHLTSGVYDIIAIVEAETHDKLKETITYQIRGLPGVKTTLTMVVVG